MSIDQKPFEIPIEHMEAQQQFKEDSDLGIQITKFRRTGQVPKIMMESSRKAMYGEANTASFHDMMITSRQAQEEFEALPARVRQLCKHKSENLVEVLSNEDNREELIKLGVFQGKEDELIQKVELVNQQKTEEQTSTEDG